MIEKIIDYSARNKFVIFLIYSLLILWGIWALYNTPVDAIPDLSDNQVIVFTEWMGQSPKIIEEQITYPLSTNLQGLPKVKAVRGQSMFGMSFIFVIFEDDVDIYWARSRVLEKLNYASSFLPKGIVPTLGPDGTGVGHIFWYTVEGKNYDLAELRAIQDWYIRYQLTSVNGVSEVASIGGFVKQYQVDLNPQKLAFYDIHFMDVINAIQSSNKEVGGKILEQNNLQIYVRGESYIKSISDIENIVVKVSNDGKIFLKDIATIQFGNDLRLGLLDKNGDGEAVGGIVVMRYGENPKDVIKRVKGKIEEIAKGLPSGVEIKTAYDRSDLIEKTINTLKNALVEEAIIVSIIVMLFIFHFRSALRILIEIPVSILISFILMKHFGITSNIMSLGGLAIAIGVLVDSSIVLVENAYRNIAHAELLGESIDYTEISIRSAKQVGKAIFFSLAIIVVSFLPVFFLEGQEGKLFHPLAWTKTFALAASAIISITLVPMLMTMLMRGKFRSEEKNPLSKILMKLYEPLLKFALKFRKTTLAINLLALILTIPMFNQIGSEFMPSLDEGSILFMPVTLPNISITEAKRILQVQDKIIKEFPEVSQVLGKVGRAETSTDNAPISMIETIILLKPKSEWRNNMTKEKIIAELDSKLQIPGVRNGWTQPIINRINMLSTGVRTDLGVKVFGDNLDTLEKISIDIEKILKKIDGASDIYAERTIGGDIVNIDLKEEAILNYGINSSIILDAIEMAIGGENISTAIEGRKRFPIRVRFEKDFRDNIDALKNLLIPIPNMNTKMNEQRPSYSALSQMQTSDNMSSMSSQNFETVQSQQTISQNRNYKFIPLSLLANITQTSSPSMIASENGMLRSVVFLNVRGRDMGNFVNAAKEKLNHKLNLPNGYYISWSGQYENQIRAKDRLQLIIPIVFFIIYVMLYFIFKSFLEAALVMLSVPFALIGGIYLIYFLGYNFSVAVWIGFIALYGVAVETGVVMVIYLHEALNKYILSNEISIDTINKATVEGAVLRLRPKIMTVATNLLGLLPIMWSSGTGSDIMKPIAAPMVGGIITSAIHVLFVTPVIFSIMKEKEFLKGKLFASDVKH